MFDVFITILNTLEFEFPDGKEKTRKFLSKTEKKSSKY